VGNNIAGVCAQMKMKNRVQKNSLIRYIGVTLNNASDERAYVHTLLPELYALPHPNFFKFHIPTSGLAHALSLHLLPLSGTHCLAVLIFVNL